MGQHTAFVNGSRGEDGSATVPPFQPLDVSRFIPLPGGHVADLPQPAELGWWQRQRQAVSAHSAAYRVILAAVPVVLVNVVAFAAQLGFWSAHLHLMLEAVLVALALESIAVYLAWQAHLAQLADDSAMRLRMAAYGMALGIGILNYTHFMGPGWRPTVPAVTFGMMSAISPWLWSVHSRRVSRDALKERGLIEPHAVRLGATRLMWHPFRCIRVMSRATWTGENDPALAIALPPVPPLADGQDSDSDMDKEPDADADMTVDNEADSEQDIPVVMDMDKPQVVRTRKTVTGQDKAADIIRRNPGLSNAEVAKRAHVSEKTVTRARAAVAGKE